MPILRCFQGIKMHPYFVSKYGCRYGKEPNL
nr:MAG TPA: hypothetical protein [Caudoviricetes sp.]